MAKLIALEWDAAEARVAVARADRGGEVTIEQAFAIPLATRGAEPSGEEETAVNAKLIEALRARQLGRADAVVALGRANIELRRLQLPPTPPEELPDMVRLQAMRQFSNIGDQWPIDYIPLSQTESNVDVLAAAISPAVVENVQQVASEVDLNVKNLVLRPFAAASLLKRSRPDDKRCRLVVDLLSSDADLFVLAGDKVAFVRTVRLPHTEGVTPALVTSMIGEVRRTVAAAQSQLGGQRIESIVVCGDPARYADLQTALEGQISLPIDFFNPFSAVTLSPELQRELPEFPGRYTPLFGMLLDSATATAHTIDFLHPRRRPEPTNHRQRILIWSAVAIAACCLLAAGVKFQFDRMDQENANLRATLAGLEPAVEAAKRKQAEMDRVEEFQMGQIPWLVDLQRISDRLPRARDAIVTDFSASWFATRGASEQGEGQIVLKGMVRNSDHIAVMRNSLRAGGYYRVDGKGVTPNRRGTDYHYRFDETLRLIATREPDPESESASESASGDVDSRPDEQEVDLTTEVTPSARSHTAGSPSGRQSS